MKITVPLKDIILTSKGKKHDNVYSSNDDGRRRYIQIEDLRNNDNLKYTDEKGVEVLENDLIIAWDGANAGTIGFGLNGFIGSTLARLRIKQKNFDTNFLGWFLRSKFSYLRNACTGATIPHINKISLESLEVPAPNLQTQKQIASILEDADRARQQRKAANALTEQFLQNSFLHLFGDPVLNDKGWEIKELSSVFASKPSLGTTTPVSVNGHYKIVRVGEIGTSDIALTKCGNVDLSSVERNRYNLLNGDILLARAIGSVDHLGKASIVKQTDEVLVFDSHVMRLRFDQKKINPYYFYHLLQSKGGRKMFLDITKRTAVQFNVNSTQISAFKIPLPPLPLQQHFASLVADAEILRQKQHESERELEHLFQALLQKYFGAAATSVIQASPLPLPLAAEPSKEYKTVVSSIPVNKKGFAKYVLAGKIIKEYRNTLEFTHIKFQKLQHLCEYLLEEELDQNFYYQTAGPYDNKLMHNLAPKMRQLKWFTEDFYVFNPLDKAPEIDSHFNRYFGSKKPVFDKLFQLLGNATEDKCEIISTLFAIWNDMLIQKEVISDTEIIKRFYQWSNRKKRYNQDQLLKALQWMREVGIRPVGFGPVIKHKKS